MITLEIRGESPEEILSTVKGFSALIVDTLPAKQPDRPAPTNTSPAMPAPFTPAAVNPTQVAPAPAQAGATPVMTSPAQTASHFSAPAPIAPPAPTVPTVAPPVAPPPTYTHEQVGKAGADLVAANPGLMPTLMAMLQRHGAQVVTDLKLEQLGPFATEMRGLGARI